MPTKSYVPWLLAALVLVAYSHCVVSHAIEAADQHRHLVSSEIPLDSTRTTCGNESSCLCKGATLAIGVQAPPPELGLVYLVCAASTAAERLEGIGCEAVRRTLPDDGNPPASGSSSRARLQNFLL